MLRDRKTDFTWLLALQQQILSTMKRMVWHVTVQDIIACMRASDMVLFSTVIFFYSYI